MDDGPEERVRLGTVADLHPFRALHGVVELLRLFLPAGCRIARLPERRAGGGGMVAFGNSIGQLDNSGGRLVVVPARRIAGRLELPHGLFFRCLGAEQVRHRRKHEGIEEERRNRLRSRLRVLPAFGDRHGSDPGQRLVEIIEPPGLEVEILSGSRQHGLQHARIAKPPGKGVPDGIQIFTSILVVEIEIEFDRIEPVERRLLLRLAAEAVRYRRDLDRPNSDGWKLHPRAGRRWGRRRLGRLWFPSRATGHLGDPLQLVAFGLECILRPLERSHPGLPEGTLLGIGSREFRFDCPASVPIIGDGLEELVTQVSVAVLVRPQRSQPRRKEPLLLGLVGAVGWKAILRFEHHQIHRSSNLVSASLGVCEPLQQVQRETASGERLLSECLGWNPRTQQESHTISQPAARSAGAHRFRHSGSPD